MNLSKILLNWLLCLFAAVMNAGGPGRFDSVGGDYDDQTGFSFYKTLFMQAHARTIVGKLVAGSKKVGGLEAGEPQMISNSSVFLRQKITQGDMVRLTMQQYFTGLPVYGDQEPSRGDYLAYNNMEARVNFIKSPAFPVLGEMNKQRIAHSITNLPGSVREAALDWMAEEIERQFIISQLYGASPSALETTANGGLGVSLGVGAGVGAGTPLMGRWWYTTDTGFPTYSTTGATWNSTVNDAVNGIDSAAADQVTLAQLKIIRRQLDVARFRKIYFGGKWYKAVALCDPEVWYRIDNLLDSKYQNADVRGDKNRTFGVNYSLEYDGVLYIPCETLEKFRPAYNAGNGYIDIGPGLTQDHRDYTVTSDIGLIIFLGNQSTVEGFNGAVNVRTATAKFGEEDGMEINVRTKLAYIRGEFYAKDGRTDTATGVVNESSMVAAFYEPGVGANWS